MERHGGRSLRGVWFTSCGTTREVRNDTVVVPYGECGLHHAERHGGRSLRIRLQNNWWLNRVFVSVVQIGPVGMGVFERRMLVYVRMPAASWKLLVKMVVMAIVMVVQVFVLPRGMPVHMSVLLQVKQANRSCQHQRGDRELPGKGLPQHQHCEQYAPERRARED